VCIFKARVGKRQGIPASMKLSKKSRFRKDKHPIFGFLERPHECIPYGTIPSPRSLREGEQKKKIIIVDKN
jgi:hypothetical protein